MKWDLLVAANPVWEISTLVEEFPAAEPDLATPLLRAEDGGGSAANTACALACAGWKVAMVGRVGDDASGKAAVAALRRRGVHPDVEIIRGGATKYNHLFVRRKDRTTAFRAFFPERIVPPWAETPGDIREARYFLLDRLAASSTGWLRARSDSAGFSNILNQNAPGPGGLSSPRLREALPFLRMLQLPESDGSDRRKTTNASTVTTFPLGAGPVDQRAEARRIDRTILHRSVPFDPLSQSDVVSLHTAGVEIIVRTRGASGVIVNVVGREPLALPAVATELIDPTGAGDAFAAGLLDGLMRETGLPVAAGRGLDWAARACRHLGARGWLDHEPPERT